MMMSTKISMPVRAWLSNSLGGQKVMEQEIREERRGYQCGYDDGKRGPDAYNDSRVDVTGPVIVWTLNSSRYAESYAQGFHDALGNGRVKFGRRAIVLLFVSVVFVTGFIALWR
jgi:hypothetical protein